MAVPCEQVMSQKPSVPTESGQPRTLPKKALLVLLLLQLQHKRSWGLPAIKQGCLLLAPGVLHALPLLLLELRVLLWGTLRLAQPKQSSTGLLLRHLRHGT